MKGEVGVDVRCKICGTLKDISPVHKEFQLLSENPNSPYICEFCSKKIQYEMQNAHEIFKQSYNPPIMP